MPMLGYAICHFGFSRGENWSHLMDSYQMDFHIICVEYICIYCHNDLPISHTSPVHSGGHSQRNPPTRSIQVPPCSQGPPEHSSISVCVFFYSFYLFRFCFIVNIKKNTGRERERKDTQHYKININRKPYSVHPMTWDYNKTFSFVIQFIFFLRT